MSANAIFSRVRPFVVAASARACTSIFNAGKLVRASAGKRSSHRSPSDTAWSTSFWIDGSSGPSSCGRGRTPNVAANRIAKTNLML